MGYMESITPATYSKSDARQRRNAAIEIRIARGLDDLLMVYSIRSAVYIAEQDCPFSEEFDGNDHCATHILGFIEGEPAGCLRVRFFGEFVKLERLAVRKSYRRSLLAFNLVRHGFDLARRKGFSHVYGHAREGLEPFWARFGGKFIPGKEEFVFSDHKYTEMVTEITPADDAITLASDPMVILRPEGDWDRPGVLEYSNARPTRSVDENSVRRPKSRTSAR